MKGNTRTIALLSLVTISASLALPVEPSKAQSSEKQEVPTQLFGIGVGRDYNLGDPQRGDLGDFPVKKFTGFKKFFGSGASYYFQPIKAHSAFEYIEKKEKPDDKFFSTSFRAYLYPIIPENVQSSEQLEQHWKYIKHRVAVVEWSKTFTKKDDAYYTAMNWCATFQATFSASPKITDLGQAETRWYSCEFTSGDRTFEAQNVGAIFSVSLKLRKDIVEKFDEEVEQHIRSLQGKELLE